MPKIYGKIINNIPELQDKLINVSEKQMMAAMIMWHQVLINEILVGSRTGRIYPVPNAKNQTYQASAPGEPPARRTGALASNYAARTKRDSNKILIGELGSTYDYARDLESGTSKMEKRPHLKPAFIKAKDKIIKALSHNWDI